MEYLLVTVCIPTFLDLSHFKVPVRLVMFFALVQFLTFCGNGSFRSSGENTADDVKWKRASEEIPFNSKNTSSSFYRRSEARVSENARGHVVSTMEATHNLYCNLYSFYVESTSEKTHQGTVFKNPHCALCNGVSLNETKCHRHYPIQAGTFFTL